MSCLFHSIGRMVRRSHSDVRATICDFLEDNLARVHMGVSIETWLCWNEQDAGRASLEDGARNCAVAMNYIRNMRMEGTWGGAMEISAATQIYRRDIVVHAADGAVVEFKTTDGDVCAPSIHLRWNGFHYEPAA